MKRLLSLSMICLLWVSFVQAQDMEKYRSLTTEADALYDKKDFKASAEKFEAAFATLDGKAYPFHRYNAACSHALAGNKKKAFYHLHRLAENPKTKYRDLDHITQDKDLVSLHKKKRKWKKLIAIVKANKEEYEKDLDKPLAEALSKIRVDDQKYRSQIREVSEKHGNDSQEMKDLWKKMHEMDSINTIKVTKILDERGWLGPKIVGQEGNTALFLVIQHADLDVQLKYLPMMEEAVKKGDARASSFALLVDRTNLRQGKPQIYGSQIGTDRADGSNYVMELIDPEKVNERRATVGLGKIEDYIKRWDITWDIEKHKAKVAKIKAAEKAKKEKSKQSK